MLKLLGMFRIVFTLILTVNLLVCPLRCASCGTEAESIAECVPATCSCCHHGYDYPPKSDDVPLDDVPLDDCTCSTCLCEGATLQEGVYFSDVGSQPACFGQGLAVVQSDVGTSIQRIAARENKHSVCTFCRRNVWVAFQSWLI